MPFYDYYCPSCGYIEEFHSINEKLSKCPHCGGKVTRKIMSATPVRFKGSGFYRNKEV